MKEALKLIFGKEWAWFTGLSMGDRLRVVWFMVSLMLVCHIGGCSLLCAVAVVVNFVASGIAVHGVSGEGLEE